MLAMTKGSGMPDFFFNAVGLLGPVCFTWAYLQLSLGKWHGGMMRTHLLNLLGAVAILVSMIRFPNKPMLVLEVCWLAISLYGMWRARKAAR